jgi:hypothetical protein
MRNIQCCIYTTTYITPIQKYSECCDGCEAQESERIIYRKEREGEKSIGMESNLHRKFNNLICVKHYWRWWLYMRESERGESERRERERERVALR